MKSSPRYLQLGTRGGGRETQPGGTSTRRPRRGRDRSGPRAVRVVAAATTRAVIGRAAPPRRLAAGPLPAAASFAAFIADLDVASVSPLMGAMSRAAACVRVSEMMIQQLPPRRTTTTPLAVQCTTATGGRRERCGAHHAAGPMAARRRADERFKRTCLASRGVDAAAFRVFRAAVTHTYRCAKRVVCN